MFLRRGMTHDDIADEVEKTTGVRLGRSTISGAIVRAGLSTAQRYDDELPWIVKIAHQRDYPAKMLRCLARKRAGLTITVEEQKRLDSWLERMERDNTVVAYDSTRGFGYGPRSAEDPADLPIHVSEVRFD
jgi:hypothetical protein